MKSPFWWVVKLDGRYIYPGGGRDGVPEQRYAHQYFSRHEAKDRAAGLRGSHIVRVWARLPAPKLPAWVKPRPLGPREVAVWRQDRVEVVEYLFRMTEGGYLMPVTRRFHMPHRRPYSAPLDAGPPDVWAEGAMRAAAFLRAERRAGR